MNKIALLLIPVLGLLIHIGNTENAYAERMAKFDELSLEIDQIFIKNKMSEGCTLIEAYTLLVD